MKIPIGDSVNPSEIRGDRLSMNAPDLSPIGRGVQNVGSAISKLAGQWRSGQKRMDGYKANLALERWTREASGAYQRNMQGAAPDGSDFLEKQDKFLTESFSKVRTAIADPDLRAKAEAHFVNTRNSQLVRGMQDVEGQRARFVMETTAESVAETVRNGALRTPAEFNDFFDNAVRPRVASALANPVDRDAATSELARQMRTELVRLNPSVAVPKRTEGDDPMPTGGVWEGMTPDEWQGLQKSAMRQDEARLKAEAEARDMRKAELLTAGYDMVRGGSLTPDWLDENRDALTATEARNFSAALQRGNSPLRTDKPVYADLMAQAVRADDLGEVQDLALEAHAQGRLSKDDFGRVVTAARETEKAKAQAPWFADMRKSLVSRLAPADASDADLYAARLEGVAALDEWFAANPQAKRDDVKKKANEIAGEYVKGTVQALRGSLDMPRFASASRYAMTPETIAAAGQQLASAYRSGKMSASDLNREAALLKRWSTLFEEEAKIGTSEL